MKQGIEDLLIEFGAASFDKQMIFSENLNEFINWQFSMDPERFTVIHLSWIMKREINKYHPTVEYDGNFNNFLEYENSFKMH